MFEVGDLYKKKYYVYEHIIDDKVFYIGKGTKTRAVEFHERNILWNVIVKERLSEVKVNILANFDDELEAIKYERNYIKSFSKSDNILANVIHNTKLIEHLSTLNLTQEDVDFAIKKIKENNVMINIEIPTSYLNKPLTVKDKNTLCKELYILDEKGRLKKWPTIKRYLIESNYEVEDKILEIDGKRTRVSIITLVDKKNDK